MTKKQALLAALRQRWLTPLEAAQQVGVFALSQRCGDLRREGHKVIDKWVDTGAARVKAYHVLDSAK
jgi:hypothetical protein